MSSSLSKRVGDDPSARDPRTLARVLDRVGSLLTWAWRPRGESLQHLDLGEPALVVGNHSGGPLALFEPLLLAHVARGDVAVERLPSLLLHEIMWRTPLAPLLARLGAVRASPENADALLESGRSVLVYPGGDREPFRTFRERDRISLGDRRGYIKLAIRHGVPVVPVVTTGIQSGFVCLSDGHELAKRFPLARHLRVGVLPITLSFPFGLWLGVPPPYVPFFARARVRALPPIRFTRCGTQAAADEAYVEACHRTVTGAMQRALDELARVRRDERRGVLHRWLDTIVDRIEAWTLPAPEPSRPSLAPVLALGDRVSRPSLPPAGSGQRRAA